MELKSHHLLLAPVLFFVVHSLATAQIGLFDLPGAAGTQYIQLTLNDNPRGVMGCSLAS